MPNQVLAVQDADGRPLLAQNYDPVTHQFVVQQCGPALTDATTAIPYAPAAEAPVDGFKASYSCGIGGLVVVTAATDFFTITGIAGRTVRITRCDISGAIATTAQQVEIYGFVRSTANLTGTSTTPAIVPYDSGDPAAGAIVRAYTANPGTLGTLVGTVRVAKMLLGVTNGVTVQDRLVWDFGNRPTKALVLRGATQVFAISCNALPTFSTATSFNVYIEWTEDTYS